MFELNQKNPAKTTQFLPQPLINTDDFKLAELSTDNFKCLIFVQGLVSAKDAEIRRRILTKLEGEPNLTLQSIAEDSQRFVAEADKYTSPRKLLKYK